VISHSVLKSLIPFNKQKKSLTDKLTLKTGILLYFYLEVEEKDVYLDVGKPGPETQRNIHVRSHLGIPYNPVFLKVLVTHRNMGKVSEF
jgi:hypothetical protein